MKIKIALAFVPIIIILCVYFVIGLDYNIDNSDSDISIVILNSITRNKGRNKLLNDITVESINIEERMVNGKKEFILFTIYLPTIESRLIGSIVVRKGINNKYKIESLEHGTNLNDSQIVTVKKKNHLFLYGINYNNEVAKTVAKVNNQDYVINTLGKNIYLEHYLLNKNHNNNIYIEWILYDENNNDITSKIKKRYNYFIR